MTSLSLDELFGSNETPAEHPRLREWRRLRDAGVQLRVEVWNDPQTIGLGATELHIWKMQQGETADELVDSVDWDSELDIGLAALGIRAIDSANEAERTALALRDAFRKPTISFGDGYFNGVLLQLVRDSQLDTHYPEIAEVMQYTHGNPPEWTRNHEICRDLTASAIGTLARRLERDLNYTRDEMKQIMGQAIARYLDARFSVTARRNMGLL